MQTHLDHAVAELALRQHGVASRAQLVAIGLTRHAIAWRLQSGRLHRLCAGVYAVGHRCLTREGRWMAAVLAGGAGAVLSHRAAAALWQILPGDAKPEITLTRVRRSTPTIRFHRSRLKKDEMTAVNGIGVTTVARTLLDLAATAPRQFERALREAEYRRLADETGLAVLVARHPRRRGAPIARRALAAARAADGITKSELEEEFLAFVAAFNLPPPSLNVPIESSPGHWIEADCIWPDAKLIVELDGRAAHDTTSRFHSDRARDRALAVKGWTVVRVTWRHLESRRSALAADIEALLARPLS